MAYVFDRLIVLACSRAQFWDKPCHVASTAHNLGSLQDSWIDTMHMTLADCTHLFRGIIDIVLGTDMAKHIQHQKFLASRVAVGFSDQPVSEQSLLGKD